MFSVKTYSLPTLIAVFFPAFGNWNLVAQERQPDFPYQAMVIATTAKIYSGPDQIHYATDELSQDAVVEVYRHDPNGWCAIRPPSGSFSLVPESAVDRVSPNLGVVLETDVQAWVGTRLGTVEVPLWQVKLRAEEEVEILGEVSWPNPEGYSTIWYQIAPPAGEFRWIQMSDLRLPKNLNRLPLNRLPEARRPTVAENKKQKRPTSDSANLISAQIPLHTPNDSIQQSSYQEAASEPIPADPFIGDIGQQDLELNPPSENSETVNRGWRQASRPMRLADNRQVLDSVKPFKTPALDSPVIGARQLPAGASEFDATSIQAKDSVAESSTRKTTPVDSSLISVSPILGPVSERIRKLESQLTAQMQNPPASWDMESILRQSTSIVSSTNDVREREHAQRLQQKIRNCVNIQSRYGNAFSANQPKDTPSSKPLPRTNDVQLGTTYDAHGWLNRLVRDNGRMSPTYVLEDETGKITHHIGASPGLNLQRYLKQKVGVFGRRGYHRNLGLDHVTAERVIVISKHR